MFYILLPLFVWVGGSNGQQYEGCDFVQELEPGRSYWMYNAEYPQNYSAGSSCRWTFTSKHTFEVNCESFEIPASEKCSGDALIFNEVERSIGHRYCGSGNFSIISRAKKLTVTLSTSKTSPGGHFLCSVRMQTVEEENADCRCGWKNPTRIIGGEATGVNEYPMMAALVDLSRSIAYCGATIINKRQVLTAEHCVQRINISTLAVLVGDHDLGKGSDTNASKLYLVNSMQLYSPYNSLTFEGDIALLTTQVDMAFSLQVGPVCLPFQHARDSFAGSAVEMLGWGLTQPNRAKATVLQKAQVPVITNLRCRQEYADITDSQICTKGEKGVDACQYDSGGPLLWQNPTTRRLVSVGIISSGRSCATGEAAKNTRVGSFIDWIVANTPPGINYCAIE